MEFLVYVIGFFGLIALFENRWFWGLILLAVAFVLYENNGDIDKSINYVKDKVERVTDENEENPGKKEHEEKFKEKEYKPGDPL